MNKEKDYYKILGVSQNADKKEIKKAYRQLARKFHPDINPGNRLSEEKFKEIGEAYTVLVDDITRLQYDTMRGLARPKPQPEQTKKQAEKAYKDVKPAPEKPKAPPPTDFQKNFKDIFSEFTKGLAKNFEAAPNPETIRPNAQRGEDITTEVNISITESHNGTVRKVNILRTEICPKCKGKRLINHISCNNCNGTGEISLYKQLNVQIPPKVKEGSKIKIANEGNKGINGGENGDLYLMIHIIKNSHFTFDGLNVHCEVPVTPTEAALGAEIQVPAIDGFVTMKIPPETRSGQKFKLAGEGLPDTASAKKGDQIVVIRIEIPPNLSEREKELYRELAKIRSYNPREHTTYER